MFLLASTLTHFYPGPKEDNTFRIIHCGGISMRKGVHYLLQAFTELNLPGTELWLIGSMTDEIKPFLRKWGSPAIRHQGPFPERELHKYYSQGSVFCLASIADGFGMVVPQAMACGLPVIITENVRAADIVTEGETGFAIPIRNVDALKEKLLLLYDNPDLCRHLGDAAYQSVKIGHTWDDSGDRLVNFLHSLGTPTHWA
jgi:glycosyltransferase involved in cell wall biosynthesis